MREILLTLEAQEDGESMGGGFTVPGHNIREVQYHVHLMGQAGLLTVVDIQTLGDQIPLAVPLSITWAGYDFLGATKDKDGSLWQAAKDKVIGPAGGVAFSVLLEWLKTEALRRLGIDP
ncbi:MAG: DUF2513 domain-containing protein [Steroidobacteraceae bacterium]|nr:DUF2513 domain-containing protein [Steroidobacteraceae bacterium]